LVLRVIQMKLLVLSSAKGDLMNCENSVFSIFTGDAKAMNLKAVYAQSFNPLDLTSCTAISVSLPNADGSFSSLTLSSSAVSITSPAVLGNFVVSATAIGGISSLLNVGELQTFNVTFTIAGAQITVPYISSLSVFQST
jgi:hypothetical protein